MLPRYRIVMSVETTTECAVLSFKLERHCTFQDVLEHGRNNVSQTLLLIRPLVSCLVDKDLYGMSGFPPVRD